MNICLGIGKEQIITFTTLTNLFCVISHILYLFQLSNHTTLHCDDIYKEVNIVTEGCPTTA